MTVADQIDAARIGSRRAAGGRHREYLGDAWIGVHKLLTRVPAPDRGLMVRAAWCGVMNARRKESGKRPVEQLADLIDHRAVSLDLRLIEAWAEYRPARRLMPMRERVWAYLIHVEGWTNREVCAVWGLSEAGVSGALAKAGMAGGRLGRRTVVRQDDATCGSAKQ